MKILSCFFVLLAHCSGYAEEFVNFNDLTGKQIEAISSGKCPDVVVQVDSGTFLTVNTCIQGNLILLDSENSCLQTQKQLFFKYNKTPMISDDQKTWKKFSDFITEEFILGLKWENPKLKKGKGEAELFIAGQVNER